MRKITRLHFTLFLSLCFCLTGLPVFAADSPDTVASAALLKRAAEYWQFKVKGELDKALPYEDPQLVKDLPLAEYVKSMGTGAKWLSATPEKAVIEGDKAGVYLKIRYIWTFVDPGQQPENGNEGYSWDHWTLINGTWYHKFRSYDQKAKEINEIVSKKLADEKAKQSGEPATTQDPQEKPKQ